MPVGQFLCYIRFVMLPGRSHYEGVIALKFKIKEVTKNHIVILVGAIILFAFHWIGSYFAREGDIEMARKARMSSQITDEVRDSKIARAIKDFDETSVLCCSAISVYSVAIVGLLYFDRRESRGEQ